MRPKAVFFDSGGVIARLEAPKHVIFARASRELGRPLVEAKAKEAFSRADRLLEDRKELLLADTMAFERVYWELLFRESGLGSPDGAIEERFEALAQRKEYRSMYPDVVPALEELKREGYRVGLLSNSHPDLRKLLVLFDLLGYFDAVIISGEVGMQKPDRRIFELAAARVRVEPHDAVHIGDNPVVDFEGARRAGFQAILLNREGGPVLVAGPVIADLFSVSETISNL